MALLTLVLAFDRWLASIPNRSDLTPRAAIIQFHPLRLDAGAFAPLRLVGAWRVSLDDPRFGGISALAADRDGLIALTDSGTVLRFPKPDRDGGTAQIRDLPAGPGDPGFKANRDSEALVRDPLGRGWWVAFEHRHQLWLYDPAFARPLDRIRLGRHWRANRGIEAMLASDKGLLLFPEEGQEVVQLRGRRMERRRLASRFGRLSDAARTADGRILLVARNLGLSGLDNRLLVLDSGWNSRLLAKLGLGPIDNVEALAAEPRGDGGTRLWLMTDNDFRPGARTLLVALDLPPER